MYMNITPFSHKTNVHRVVKVETGCICRYFSLVRAVISELCNLPSGNLGSWSTITDCINTAFLVQTWDVG